jgi:hypothetical protein
MGCIGPTPSILHDLPQWQTVNDNIFYTGAIVYFPAFDLSYHYTSFNSHYAVTLQIKTPTPLSKHLIYSLIFYSDVTHCVPPAIVELTYEVFLCFISNP